MRSEGREGGKEEGRTKRGKLVGREAVGEGRKKR